MTHLRSAPAHGAGSKEYLGSLISATSSQDAAMLVVDASAANIEQQLSNNGVTRDHAFIARGMGIRQLLLAITKMDAVDYDKEVYESVKSKSLKMLSKLGFKEAEVGWPMQHVVPFMYHTTRAAEQGCEGFRIRWKTCMPVCTGDT